METVKMNTTQEALQQHLAMEQVKSCKVSLLIVAVLWFIGGLIGAHWYYIAYKTKNDSAFYWVYAVLTTCSLNWAGIGVLVDIIAAPFTAKETEKANIKKLTESLDQEVVI